MRKIFNPLKAFACRFEIFQFGPYATNTYLFESEKDLVIIDAAPDSWRNLQNRVKESKKNIHIFLTHGHWDHVADTSYFKPFGKVYAHKDDNFMLTDRKYFLSEMKPVTVDNFIDESNEFDILNTKMLVKHIPGHTPGNVAYYFPKEKAIFVGDALFKGSVGRTDLPGGNWETLRKSILEKIYKLPDDVVIFPGHGPLTTVGEEKRENAFVNVDE